LDDLHGPRGLDTPRHLRRLPRSLFNLLPMVIPPGLAAVYQVVVGGRETSLRGR